MSNTTQEKQEIQEYLEYTFNKNNLNKRLKEIFDDDSLKNVFKANNIDPDFGVKVICKMALFKRADVPTLVGSVMGYYDNNGQRTVDEIQKIVEIGFLKWENYQFITQFTLEDKVQAELDAFQYPLPMVIEPKKITRNCSTGYCNWNTSLVLKRKKYIHNADLNRDHINRVNKIAWELDMDTARTIKAKCKDIDKCKDGETEDEFNKRKKAWQKYCKTTMKVMDLLVSTGNTLFLTHAYDKRGRIYCRGYHVNYQGMSWNKAVLQFKNKEFLK